MMSRKDFRAIAEAISYYRQHCDPEEKRIVDAISNELTSPLKMANPRFDRDRFLEACKHES